jgi:hypothetical protein
VVDDRLDKYCLYYPFMLLINCFTKNNKGLSLRGCTSSNNGGTRICSFIIHLIYMSQKQIPEYRQQKKCPDSNKNIGRLWLEVLQDYITSNKMFWNGAPKLGLKNQRQKFNTVTFPIIITIKTNPL